MEGAGPAYQAPTCLHGVRLACGNEWRSLAREGSSLLTQGGPLAASTTSTPEKLSPAASGSHPPLLLLRHCQELLVCSLEPPCPKCLLFSRSLEPAPPGDPGFFTLSSRSLTPGPRARGPP